jgi:hypothetical protein
VARYLAAKGYEPRYEIGLEVLKRCLSALAPVPPEDTLRFHALRLHEVGLNQIQPAEADRSGHRLAFPQ